MIRGKSVRMQVFVRPQPCSQPVEPESKSIEYFLYRSPVWERLRSSRMVFSWLSGLWQQGQNSYHAGMPPNCP